MTRKRWDNGMYHVDVKKVDEQTIVGFWKLDTNGFFHEVSYKNLPKYVVTKTEELKKEVSQ